LLRKGRGWGRAAQIACALVSIAGAGTAGGCLNRPIQPNEPRRTSTIVEPFQQSAVDKIDLLLMLDNSRSMADKQLILAAAVPDLVSGLVNPKCVNDAGTALPAAQQPAGPTVDCPLGAKREFPPIVNIHIGIVSSSLGGHGGDACATSETLSCAGSPNPSNNDAGHLVARTDACVGTQVPTYDTSKGFLAWDPKGILTPKGESKLGEIADIANAVNGQLPTITPGIVATLKDMVQGVGQVGCGYEAQLESWYRFLIDPDPYKEITLQGGKAVPSGTDTVLLQQRKDFLRPSSLLAIIMLTDENDCSVKETGQFYFAVQQQNPQDNKKKFHLPRARQECLTNPNDPCCKSCGQTATGCPADAKCTSSPTLSDTEDDINLRCFDQKRRFGIDFLYPIDRYTQALRSGTVPSRDGTMVPNPIFSDVHKDPNDSNVRDSSLVFMAGIVGVPWQLIARTDASGNPDLLAGVDATGNKIGGFQNYDELKLKGKDGITGWERILGDPANYVAPKDAHMVESSAIRPTLEAPTSTTIDPISGHEYTNANSDLQYACIFDLPEPRDCSVNTNGCDCSSPTNDNPLCDTTVKTKQIRAKGYPGTRELSTIYSVGANGIVGSVCPAQLTDKTQSDYGYRPAIGAIIDRLKTALGGKCLPRELTVDPATKEVPCLILEARNVPGTPTCDAKEFRRDLTGDNVNAKTVALADPLAKAQAKPWNQFCEILPAGATSPAALKACQTDPSTNPLTKTTPAEEVNGWCYVDPTQAPDEGSDKIVANCPANEKRLIRFIGKGNPVAGGTLFITCSGD
jgi:hypothetical protein